MTTTKLYSVTLQDACDLPFSDRIEAEMRFARELEMVLGDEESVAETYAAWSGVVQSDADRIDRSSAAMTAARWYVAVAVATQIGFSRLGSNLGEAHFEVRLERHAA